MAEPTVVVKCQACGCPLAFVRADYEPERHRGFDVAPLGPMVSLRQRNDPLIAVLQQARKAGEKDQPHERRKQDEPIDHLLNDLGPKVKAWCDTTGHGYIEIPTAGLRARHTEALRTGKKMTWRILPTR